MSKKMKKVQEILKLMNSKINLTNKDVTYNNKSLVPKLYKMQYKNEFYNLYLIKIYNNGRSKYKASRSLKSYRRMLQRSKYHVTNLQIHKLQSHK